MFENQTISRGLLMRIRGFLNRFAGRCKECLRKNSSYCASCDDVRMAKSLLLDIDNLSSVCEERHFVDNATDRRFAQVIAALRESGRPLRSCEIRLSGMSREMKYYILKQMCKRGLLKSSLNEDGRYTFDLTEAAERFERRIRQVTTRH